MGYEKNKWQEFVQKKSSATAIDWPLAKQLLKTYEQTKADFNAMDFNDLLYILADKFTQHPDALQQVAQQFKYVLVDEYQDTNLLQERLVEALSSVHKNLFTVGDYDQTIFSFQGSNVNIIGSFTDKYPKAKVFNLKTNFRSTPEVINLANVVISTNKRLYEKELVPHSQ